MNVTETNLPGVLVIEPRIFADDRGFFYESFNHKRFEEAVGYAVNFAQDNHSNSVKGVLRGLHYQMPPMTQGKLVRVVNGEVYDVAVDVRKDSPTFGKYTGVVLSAENKKQLWIPEGFLHGFVVLSEEADFLYKATNYYSVEHEVCVRWDDPEIGVEWLHLHGLTQDNILVSTKDSEGISLSALSRQLTQIKAIHT